MAYQKYTPFNFIALFSVIYGFFCGFSDNAMGFGWIVAFYFLPFAFFIVMADLFLQGVCKNKLKLILWIEFGIITCCVIYYLLRKY
jgi:hypothetical protein